MEFGLEEAKGLATALGVLLMIIGLVALFTRGGRR